MENISELAYELYKVQWKKDHMITAEIEQDALKDYYEGLVDFDGSYSFDDYIEEYGYLDGEIYACYEEFMDTEYLDEEYMKNLLNNDSLFEQYEYDVQEHMSFEEQLSDLYSEIDRIDAELSAEYETGETNWAANLEASRERTEEKIRYLEERLEKDKTSSEPDYNWDAITSNHSVSNHMDELSALLEKAFENTDKKDRFTLEPWHINFDNNFGIRTFQLYHDGIEVLTGNTLGKEYRISEENQVDLRTLLPVIEKALPDYKTDIKIELLIPVNVNEHWMKCVENAEYYDTRQHYRPEDISDGYGYDIVLFNISSYKALENVIIEDLDPSCIYDGATQKFKFIEAYTSVDVENGYIVINGNCFEPVKEKKVSLADKIVSAENIRNSKTLKNDSKELEKEIAINPEDKSFIAHFYVVEDLKDSPLNLTEFNDLSLALDKYLSLPKDKMKAFGIQNSNKFPGSLDFIQCKDGKDIFIKDYLSMDNWKNPEINKVVNELNKKLSAREERFER